MAYATVTLTGTYQTPDGTPHKGHVEIIPSERVIKDTTGDVILTGRVKVDLDAQGAFTVALPATDDPTLNPTGFGYTIAAKLHSSHPPAVSFSLPAALGATTVEDVTPVDPSTFAPTTTYAESSEVAALDSRVTTLETTPAVTSYNDLTDTPTIPTTAADIGAEPAGLSTTTQATIAAGPIPALEGIPLYVEGNSYASDPPSSGTYMTPGTLPFTRLARAWRTANPTTNATPATRSDEILTRIINDWTVNTTGIVGIGDGCINDTNAYGDTSGTTTTAEAFRTIFEYLTARSEQGTATNAFAFDGNWTAGTSSTPGSQFHHAFNGDTVVLLVQFTSGTGGTLTITNEAAATVDTINTGGYKQTFTGSVRLSGFGAGDHEITGTLDSGTATILGALTPNDTTPPLIIWDKPGARNYGAAADTLLNAYLTAVQAVADTFPHVIAVDMGTGWDKATMIGPDGGHRNDLGNKYAADRIHETVTATGIDFRQGINKLTAQGAGAPYTPPTASPLTPPVTVISADTFTRADGPLGTTEVGGYTWGAGSGNAFSIASNRLRVDTITTQPPVAYINDGAADGTFTLTLHSVNATAGLFVRGEGPTLANGYLFYYNGSVFRLMKRTGGSFSLIAAADPAPTYQIGDELKVVANGSSIACYVNGALVVSTTQTDYVTNTYHGPYVSTATHLVDNWEHTDAV